MIESLEVKNFKSHRKSVMAFSSGINAIIGSPNHGKTNIIRALLWWFNNRPLSGDVLFNQLLSGEVEVTGKLSNVPDLITLKKKIITSKDGKSREVKDACYSIGEREFKGMNKSVPDVIKEAFNITELNIQEQFDQPYLVNSTGGEIAKTINRITRQELADQLETNITKKVNNLNRDVKDLKTDIELKEKELKAFDGLDSIGAILDEVEDSNLELSDLKSEKENIKRIILSIETLTKEIDYLESFMKVGLIINDINKIKIEYDKNKEISILLLEFIELYNRKEYLEPMVAELLLFLGKIDKQIENFNSKIDAANKIELFIVANNDYQDVSIKYIKVFEMYIKEIEKNGLCPTCFSSIDSKAVKRIKENL
uniref:Putative ATPase domain containing protein n=1 Tax=viral metagenome TaxID=1070528 RepID=A0A6M3LKP4_9ZZZZ